MGTPGFGGGCELFLQLDSDHRMYFMEGAAIGICAPFLGASFKRQLFLLPTTTSFPSSGSCHSHSHHGAVPLLAEDPAPSQDQDGSGFLIGCGLHAGTFYFISFAKHCQDRPFLIVEAVQDLCLHEELGAGRRHGLLSDLEGGRPGWGPSFVLGAGCCVSTAALTLVPSRQVGLGISTLLLYVPTPLAATHQSGSLALLSAALWLAAELRRLPK